MGQSGKEIKGQCFPGGEDFAKEVANCLGLPYSTISRLIKKDALNSKKQDLTPMRFLLLIAYCFRGSHNILQ
ncbi:MAG TPA: hypothetical protein ACFYD4_03875 [Candidatus Wunengus sp. YC61]|uniref:hypothetical protein n=1 Tax=Candidatus Wunengus sp. YC61 TaxID=3367698 RepID=UPI0040256C8D